MTQVERVEKYMIDFGSITQLEAMRDLGIMRLSARIWDLKHEGKQINRVQEAFADGYSKGWKDCTEQYERTFEAKYEAYKAEKGPECYYARRTR